MKIVFTGTESTYKSTLAKALAEEFAFIYVPEYARAYLENVAPNVPVDPMPRLHYDAIEKGQLQLQRTHGYFSKNTKAIFDTDATVLHIWKEDKFDERDLRLLDIPNDVVYFLCYPNVAAAVDPLRVDLERREELHQRYEKLLEQLPNKVIHLNQGSLEERLIFAKSVLEERLNDPV